MNLAPYIDHTALKPNTSREDIKRLCHEALEHNFASVCVNPYYTSLVSRELKGSEVSSCTVTGFPLGNNLMEIKMAETRSALKNGAQEIDTVINLAALQNNNWGLIEEELVSLAALCHQESAIIKLILETSLLNRGQIKKACDAAVLAKVDFVKTSSGFSSGGADSQTVAFMKECVNGQALVKASGGIRSYEDAKLMIESGASRIGSSSGLKIIRQH